MPMKKCGYCGAEYPDDATVCAVDSFPLAQTETDIASPVESANDEFSREQNAKHFWNKLSPFGKCAAVALVCGVGIFVGVKLLNISFQKDQANPDPTPAIAANTSRQVEPSLTIKGFCMKMSQENARAAVYTLGFTNIHSDMGVDRAFCHNGQLILTYDSNRQLIRLDTLGSMTDQLFNVADLSMEEFVQMFINEYHLLEMKPFQEGRNYGYKYRDDAQGYELVVYATSNPNWNELGKRICFVVVPRSADRKFN
jgi:hypothetical protein